MNTAQAHGQRFPPNQETGYEKAEPLLSIQQTFIDHSMDVMIDSSGLVMDNGNSPVGSIEDVVTRLTQQMVFEFLEGHARIEELPCLGDLTNGNDEFHRTTPIPMEPFSESSEVKFLDPIFLDTFDLSSTAYSPPEHTSQSTDEIELLPENSINAHITCNKSVTDILNLDYPTTNLLFQQCDFTGKFALSTIDAGSNHDSLDSNIVPDTIFKNLAFKQQKINVNRTTEIQEFALIHHHHALTSGNLKSQFHRQHRNLNDVPVSNLCPTTASKNRPINDENTFAIPIPGTLMDYLYGDPEIPQFLDAESSSIQSEDSCWTIGKNGEGPTFSVPDPSKLMNFLYGNLVSPVFLSSESIKEEVPIYSEYDGNDSKIEVTSQSADHTIGESYQGSTMHSSVIPKTISGFMTESLRDSNGFTNGMNLKMVRTSSSIQFEEESSEISDSKLSYHQDDFNVADPSNKYKSEAHTALATEPEDPLPKNPTTFVPTISSLLYKSEDDKENITTDLLSFASNTDEPSLMNKNSVSDSYENPEICVSSLGCDQKICNSSNSTFDDPCFLGSCGSDDDAEVTDLSDCTLNAQCGKFRTHNTLNLPIESKNGSLIGAFKENEITPTSSALLKCNGEKIGSDSSFFDLSDHDELLEIYGISNQEQYTQTGYTCKSPTWPGKSDGRIQKSQAFLASNLTKNDNADGTLTADSSPFHSNTDKTSVMNKNWTDEIYERNSENSVSLCLLNQMDCAFETSPQPDNAGSIDCVPLLDSCSDDFGDSIEYQSLENHENELKFAFPDPSTLQDYFFGSVDSPRFLASGLLDGKIDNLHYSSLFGGCEQNDLTEEADLSDKMIFDQCVYDVSSINKFLCSIQLFDVSSYPFDISDHNTLLERYGINDQDQFIDGNWTCDSPTWPGKI